MRFGEYVRSKGHTAKSLAEAVGISVRTMEGYTTGRFSLKSARALFVLNVAKVLETNVEYLLSLDD